MRFFIDTADIQEIQKITETGFVDGVTTNPSLIAKSGGDIKDVIAEICRLVPGPVSAEVTATDYKTMMKEAEVLARIESKAKDLNFDRIGLATISDKDDLKIIKGIGRRTKVLT